eukprot:TRINITY_DN55555_c0_g1_i1.p1 TRINITY_DN55555_c0_g1~~TRINITY_DN55555_c0_g1_i1.p1  ORF type:complete len:626 (+),score=153.94 TRINITY_DN55555_c0_g1_i1:94-1878(+)
MQPPPGFSNPLAAPVLHRRGPCGRTQSTTSGVSVQSAFSGLSGASEGASTATSVGHSRGVDSGVPSDSGAIAARQHLDSAAAGHCAYPAARPPSWLPPPAEAAAAADGRLPDRTPDTPLLRSPPPSAGGAAANSLQQQFLAAASWPAAGAAPPHGEARRPRRMKAVRTAKAEAGGYTLADPATAAMEAMQQANSVKSEAGSYALSAAPPPSLVTSAGSAPRPGAILRHARRRDASIGSSANPAASVTLPRGSDARSAVSSAPPFGGPSSPTAAEAAAGSRPSSPPGHSAPQGAAAAAGAAVHGPGRGKGAGGKGGGKGGKRRRSPSAPTADPAKRRKEPPTRKELTNQLRELWNGGMSDGMRNLVREKCAELGHRDGLRVQQLTDPQLTDLLAGLRRVRAAERRAATRKRRRVSSEEETSSTSSSSDDSDSDSACRVVSSRKRARVVSAAGRRPGPKPRGTAVTAAVTSVEEAQTAVADWAGFLQYTLRFPSGQGDSTQWHNVRRRVVEMLRSHGYGTPGAPGALPLEAKVELGQLCGHTARLRDAPPLNAVAAGLAVAYNIWQEFMQESVPTMSDGTLQMLMQLCCRQLEALV